MKKQTIKTIFSTVMVLVLAISLSFAPGNVTANTADATAVETVESPQALGKWVPVYVGPNLVGYVCVIFGNKCRIIPIPIGMEEEVEP